MLVSNNPDLTHNLYQLPEPIKETRSFLFKAWFTLTWDLQLLNAQFPAEWSLDKFRLHTLVTTIVIAFLKCIVKLKL